MAFDTKLTDLSPNDVLSVERILETYINEAFPDLDVSPGSVMRDIIVNLYAALEQRVRTEQATILRSNSLLEITDDPDLADDAQVNRVLSNYNITRSEGTKASGFVKFIIDSDTTTLVPVGTKLTMGGLVFKVSSNVRAISSTETVLQTGDIKVVAGTAGSFFFNVPVEAELPGSKYNVKEGTKVSNFTPKIGRTVSAEAAQTMLGGKDTETNEELLAKLKQGVVGKILGGRAHIEAKLKAEFPYVISAGATGFGDPEMTRDTLRTNSNASSELVVQSTASNTTLVAGTFVTLRSRSGTDHIIAFDDAASTNGASSELNYTVGTSTASATSKTAGSIAADIVAAINQFADLGITATPTSPVANSSGHFPITLTQKLPGAEGNTRVNTIASGHITPVGESFLTGGEEPQAYHRGGTVDIHARTAHTPLVETLNVTAVSAGSDLYEFSLTKAQCDGLYEVSQVSLPVAEGATSDIGTLCIVEYDRQIELPTGNERNSPTILTGLDLGFSSYQKVRIVVEDTAAGGAATRDYVVKLLKLPYIDVLQDYVAYGENRSVAADMVVKAAVPVFCGCNIRIVKPRTAPDIDILEIKTAVANAVNAVKFGQPIPVSLIAHTVHKLIPAEAFVDLPINLFGNLYYPDKPKFADIDNEGKSFGDATYDNGSPDVKQLRTNDMLRAPYQPSRGVSDKTVAFFLNPYSVDVQVVESL